MRILLFLLLFTFLTRDCVSQQPIDERKAILIGGIKQYVWIKGKDIHKPLFLFLHGGPGNSVIPYAGKFCNELYEHFVVIQWDQRDVGETLKLNPSQKPLTLAIFQQDTQELIDSLLVQFGRSKLYLAGHSWGTALGFYMAKVHPSKLEAFIAIGSMVNQQESERIALELMKTRALETKNLQAQQALQTVRIPFENGEQLYYHRKYLFDYTGLKASFTKEYVIRWSQKWLAVFNEASRENLFEHLPEVQCPIYFFAGRSDFQTNSGLVEHYYNALKAPTKDFFWFENAGHSIPSSYGAEMQKIIISKILKVK